MKKINAVLLIVGLMVSTSLFAHNANYCIPCERDIHGHIKRSLEAKHEFKLQHPCPSAGKSKGRCEGYIIDHIVPLKHGGADVPSNMEWQTIQES